MLCVHVRHEREVVEKEEGGSGFSVNLFSSFFGQTEEVNFYQGM